MSLADKIARTHVLPEPEQRRGLRCALGIGQQEMADELGVSVQTLWKWETGRAQPTGGNRDRYSALLEQMRLRVTGG